MPETIASRPMPKRPENGLLAWQATVGYISTQYSLDAMLTLHAYPMSGGVGWLASASWGHNREQVNGLHSLIDALRGLWRQVDHNHVIFEHREAIIKRPHNYADNEWLDGDTQIILERVIQVTGAVYGTDWMLVLLYQPVEGADLRWETRLIAQSESIQTAGHGASMRDSLRDLYRNAANDFMARSGKSLDEIL